MDSLFKTESSKSTGHPSEDGLLLFVDGELAPKASNYIRSHLEACWSCRVHLEKIEETISTFIDYRNQVIKPLVDPPPRSWRGFDGQLNGLVSEVGRPSLLSALRGSLRSIFSAPPLSIASEDGHRVRTLDSPVFIRSGVGILALSVITGALMYFNRTSVVSASELLHRAAEAQENQIRATRQAVVYQKVEVKRKTVTSSESETLTWEVWNDIANVRSRNSVDISGNRHFVDQLADPKSSLPNQARPLPPSLSGLVQILRVNHMNPAMPLAAASYDTWRNWGDPKQEEMTKTRLADGRDALTLKTTSIGRSNSGAIVEASLVVRENDWHPVEERLRVKGEQGDEVFELAEAAYSVVNLNTLDPEIFAEQPVAAATKGAYTPPKAEPVAPLVATADLEVEVLRLLNDARADLGEQVSATRSADGLLRVTGIVETADRKAEIMSALQPVMNHPAVRIEIQTVVEALAQQQQERHQFESTLAPVTEQEVEINSEAIAAALELRRHLSSDEQVRDFAARMVGQSRSAMRHAYAMKRLIGQFSAEELDTLSSEGKNEWLALIRSHAVAYQNEAAALRRELQPIFFSNALEAGSESRSAVADDAVLARLVEQLFALASANDGVIRSAFAASAEGVSTSAVGSPQFWQSLRSAEDLAGRIANHP